MDLKDQARPPPAVCHLLPSGEVALDPPGCVSQPVDRNVRKLSPTDGALYPATLEDSFRCEGFARPRRIREQPGEGCAQFRVVLPAPPARRDHATDVRKLAVERYLQWVWRQGRRFQ